jgi:hypothetical protein
MRSGVIDDTSSSTGPVCVRVCARASVCVCVCVCACVCVCGVWCVKTKNIYQEGG